jgi:hypothetical protein
MLSKARFVLCLLACVVVTSAAEAAVITNNILVTNTTDITQTFSASVTLPLPPDLYGFASAEGTMTVTPGPDGTGTADLVGGDPFFFIGTGFDGVVHLDLGVGRGTSACVAVRVPETCTFPLVTNTFIPTAFVTGTSRVRFTLTAGASLAFNSTLTIEPAQAPEPSSLLLVATAAGAWRLRRRGRN